MGVAPFVPASGPGRIRPRPLVGALVGLLPQASIGGPTTSWGIDADRRTPHIDVGYLLASGIDAGRRLDCSVRIQLLPDDGSARSFALAHARQFARETLDADSDWARIVVRVDRAPVAAEQSVTAGWEIVLLSFAQRRVSVVTSVLDAHRFEPEYATFRPWPDDAPGVYDPAAAPPREPCVPRRRLYAALYDPPTA